MTQYRPPELKVLAGTNDRPEKAEDAPQFPRIEVGEFPAPPQHLNPDGVELWNDLGPQLVACGVLQTVDLRALEQLAYGWQLFRTKAKAGMDVTASEHNALIALWKEFGLTPAARRRVVATIKAAPPENRFAKHSKRNA